MVSQWTFRVTDHITKYKNMDVKSDLLIFKFMYGADIKKPKRNLTLKLNFLFCISLHGSQFSQ